MRRVRYLSVAPLLLLAGCGQSGGPARDVNAVADAIPAGIYSDVYYSEEGGDLVGMELALSHGSSSATVDVTECSGECAPVQTVPVHRHLNGLFFEYSPYGSRVTVEAMREGNGLTVRINDEGIHYTHRLAKVNREWGLRVARGL